MSKKYRNEIEKKRIDRYFMISKGLLFVTPVIAYLYVSLRATMVGVSFQEVLANEPSITIIFLIAMMNPYIAYLVGLIQKKLANKEYLYAGINMVFLLASQALVLNYVYFAMLGYTFFKALRYESITIKSIVQGIRIKQSFLYGGGSMIVVAMSCLCLFATLRIM